MPAFTLAGIKNAASFYRKAASIILLADFFNYPAVIYYFIVRAIEP
jgi:hypothetical protein